MVSQSIIVSEGCICLDPACRRPFNSKGILWSISESCPYCLGQNTAPARCGRCGKKGSYKKIDLQLQCVECGSSLEI